MRKGDAAAGSGGDWREVVLSQLRILVKQADPDIEEERKWRKASNPEGVPTLSHDGLVCTLETYRTHVKVTFAKGASLKDPSHLFNAGLDGNARRAIDIHEGDKVQGPAFKALVREAVALNQAGVRRR